jgi:hypothetical protein
MTTRYWDELGDRDPLVTDLMEVAEHPAPEEAAMHLIGMPAYDAVSLDELVEELAIEAGEADELLDGPGG